MAESLLGRVGADRAADALERSRRLDRKRVFPHFARHTGAAAVAVEPAGRAQRPVRQRRARLAALGCAGPAVRQCRAGAVLCDTLFGDLYLRPRRSVDRTRRGVGRDDLRDAGRAAAVPDDGRPLAGRRTARQPHPRNAAELHRDPRAADLRRNPLPLHGQNPRHVDAARGRRGLSGLRVHDDGAGREGAGAAA